MSTKLIIAEDHELIIDGLSLLLRDEQDIDIIATANNGKVLLEVVESSPEIDIILMDINMPVIDGIEATKIIKGKYPEIKILVLTMYKKVEFIKQLVRVGADGYILKNSGKSVLLDAISTLLEGSHYFGKEILDTMVKSFVEKNNTKDLQLVDLSEREKDVVRLIVKDMTSEEIAKQMCLSLHTINSHRKNILSKLDVKNIAGIYTYALRSGIVKGFDI